MPVSRNREASKLARRVSERRRARKLNFLIQLSNSPQASGRSLAADGARVVLRHAALGMKRAQGRPGADLAHGPPAEKKAGGSHHRFGRDIPVFPARWLSGLYVISPGTGLIAPVIRAVRNAPSQTWPQHREARTTRLHRPRHVVRLRETRCDMSRPSHPASRVVTIAIRPSCRGGTTWMKPLIWGPSQELF